MLTRLEFTNFKTWEKACLDLGRVTALFGTNSSGKSSILQFILLAKQTKNATDRSISLELNDEFVSLGSATDVIHRHDESRSISSKITFKTDDLLSIYDPSERARTRIVESNSFSVESENRIRKGSLHTTYLRYQVANVDFSISPISEGDSKYELVSGGSDFAFVRTKGRAWQLSGPVKNYAFPDQTRTYFQNAGFLADLQLAYEKEIDKIFYLGPLREHPARDYLWARTRPSDVGQRGEKSIDAILAATDNNETRNLGRKHKHKPFQQMIAYWLREMGLIDSFQVTEIAEGSNRWQAKVRTKPGGSEVLLTDVGFGISQILPVITLLYYVPEGSTVILEQPEIHLHPLAQAHLADLILNVSSARRIQIILESHSEHLLLRIQRRVAEARTPDPDIRMYFCDSPSGTSELVPLELDLMGSIGNWPANFMGDALGETIAAEKARLVRLKG